MTTVRDATLLAEARLAAATGEARALRTNARLSLSDVARVCGVDPSTVHRWESGKRTPRGLAAMRYARLVRSLRSCLSAEAVAS